MKKYSIIVVFVALIGLFGIAPFVNAGPTYPYYFNGNGSVYGGYFYNPYPYYTNPQVYYLYNYNPYNPYTVPTPTVPQNYPTPTPTPVPTPTPMPTPTPYTPSQLTPVQYNYVNITDFGFSPSTITIQKGTSVIWRNKTTIPREIIDLNGIFSSSTIYPGGIYTFQFMFPGVYTYQDSINGSFGTIIVQ
jgi:hypothetical protein